MQEKAHIENIWIGGSFKKKIWKVIGPPCLK